MQLFLLFFFFRAFTNKGQNWSKLNIKNRLDQIQIDQPVASLLYNKLVFFIYRLKLAMYHNQISLVKYKKRKIYIWLLLAVLQCHHIRTLTNTKAPHADSQLIYFNIISASCYYHLYIKHILRVCLDAQSIVHVNVLSKKNLFLCTRVLKFRQLWPRSP